MSRPPASRTPVAQIGIADGRTTGTRRTVACYRPRMDAVAPDRARTALASGRAARRPTGWAASAYRDAWDLQKRLAGARADDRIGDQLLLLEHPAVLTLGRGADESHVLASPALLEARGIELLRVERGGEVTYHGPGQLVAYPIIKLADRGLLLRPLVRALEGALVDTCAAFGVAAARREGHPGCWIDPEGPLPRKIGALGIRIERGVSYHGIALNVDVDLADFDLIDPCGMPGLDSTSIAREAGRRDEPPSTDAGGAAAAVFAPRVRRPDRRPARGPAAAGRRSRGGARRAWSGWPSRLGGMTDHREALAREPGPVRAAQGRDHRLVGGDDHRPHVRARAVRAAGRPGRTTTATASTAACRRATASACASSRTSRSPSPGPRRRRARGTGRSPR